MSGLQRSASWLVLPAVVLILLAGCSQRPHQEAVVLNAAPTPPQESTEPVTIVEYSDDGVSRGASSVHRLALSDDQWRARLSPLAFSITRQKDTEFAFTGRYNKHSEPGLYRCVACSTALFSSEAKFDSPTGWPSYTAPVSPENVYTLVDVSLGMAREEVLCRRCDSHLGHVFPDGPERTGMRYCINSAALRFVAFPAAESH